MGIWCCRVREPRGFLFELESATGQREDLCALDSSGLGWNKTRGGRDICTVSGLVKAVFRITMACEDDNLMAPVLQSHGSVNYQPLGTANAKIWMEKDNSLLFFRR